MNGEDLSTEYIFFLNYSEKLPEAFYYFAESFSKHNIKLIPISIEDMFKIEKNRVSYVLSVVSTLDTALKYNVLQKRIVEFSLMNRRLFLFDVNSFGRISYYKKIVRMRNYKYYKLPAEVSDLANDIFQIYAKERLKGNKWPGGARVKLPQISLS